MAKTVYRCNQDMVCRVAGQRQHFSLGDMVFEDHPVKPEGHPNFEEISAYVDRTSQHVRRGVVVEQATADPGEKRRVGRPRGSKNTPKDTAVTPKNVAPDKAQKEEASDGQA